MLELKPIDEQAIPAAMEKALRYRLLNEPSEAESICRDVLGIDPDNNDAQVMLVLALTDQFARDGAANRVRDAMGVAATLADAFERTYYTGIVHERYAKVLDRAVTPGSSHRAYDMLREAMQHFEDAEKIRPPDNYDPILRWNSCVRLLRRHPDLCPEPEEYPIPLTLE